MKANSYHRNRYLRLLILIGLLGNYALGFSATKYALVVAVGNQPTDTRWISNHAQKDAEIMKQSFKLQGFDSIVVLTNEKATKKAVVKALEQAIVSLRKGDVFAFHFSGNGQQMEDDNGDDIDQLDEALVLYGAPSEYDRWYRDENHLRDDEFSEIIDRMRSKLGLNGEVLITLDAGFGSSLNGPTDSTRGGMKAMVPENFVNTSRFADVSASIYEDRPFGAPAESFAPVICISAGLSNQIAYEYQGAGALTRALERVFENKRNDETYEKLFSRIGLEVKSMGIVQSPVIEGFYDIEIYRNAADATGNERFDFGGLNPESSRLLNVKNRDYEIYNSIDKSSNPRLMSLF
ncbi:MAG: hypothetical protein GC181_14880 [Bacteroidetes bacterium]|nr:hypothetical protein [Bacteroidota bacterium]